MHSTRNEFTKIFWESILLKNLARRFCDESEIHFYRFFSGIGGFRLALENLGGTCIGFSEIERDAISMYCKKFKESQNCNIGDIRKCSDVPIHDFMTAGVPCQSWSIAGKNLGFDDDRGQLWNDILYFLNKSRPKAFIFENVKGLADPRNKEALQYIMSRIEMSGYYAQKFVINACDYGTLQTRIRIYIVGFREKKYFQRFWLPRPCAKNVRLGNILDGCNHIDDRGEGKRNLSRSLSCNENGINDYFLFNNSRNNTRIY